MSTGSVNAAGRLDRIPVGAFHWRLFAIVGAGMFFDGFDSHLAAGVLGAMTKSGYSDFVHNAHFISATFVGMTIGALGAGAMGDRMGRRLAYQINLLIFGLASLAGAFAPSIDWLIAFRVINVDFSQRPYDLPFSDEEMAAISGWRGFCDRVSGAAASKTRP